MRHKNQKHILVFNRYRLQFVSKSSRTPRFLEIFLELLVRDSNSVGLVFQAHLQYLHVCVKEFQKTGRFVLNIVVSSTRLATVPVFGDGLAKLLIHVFKPFQLVLHPLQGGL